MELFWLGLLIGAIVVGGAGIFLLRRGAMTLDRSKARQEVDEVVGNVRDDVRKWRDKL